MILLLTFKNSSSSSLTTFVHHGDTGGPNAEQRVLLARRVVEGLGGPAQRRDRFFDRRRVRVHRVRHQFVLYTLNWRIVIVYTTLTSWLLSRNEKWERNARVYLVRSLCWRSERTCWCRRGVCCDCRRSARWGLPVSAGNLLLKSQIIRWSMPSLSLFYFCNRFKFCNTEEFDMKVKTKLTMSWKMSHVSIERRIQ